MPLSGFFRSSVVILCGLLFIDAEGAGLAAGLGTTEAEFQTRNWRKEDGLPDNSIRALLQTRDGYLWIGTARGLARFDGLKFVVWDRQNTPAFRVDEITCLAEDVAGNLWIGTAEGLVRKHGDQLTRATGNPGVEEARISDLHPNKKGGVWVGWRGGLILLTAQGVFSYGTTEDWRPGGVHCLHEDQSGNLWIAAWNGLSRLEPTGEFRTFRVDENSQPFEIKDAPDGGLWVIMSRWNDGGWLYHFQDGRWQKISEKLTVHARGIVLAPGRGRDLWLTSPVGTMDRLHSGVFTRYPIPSVGRPSTPQQVLEDREGNLWIGTDESGLMRWQPRRVRSYTTNEGLVHDKVWAVHRGGEGSVWIGSEGGLSCFRNGSVTNFSMDQGLPHSVVRALVEDRKGRLWIGTGAGLACLEAGHIRQHRFEEDWVASKIRALVLDRQNFLWVGSARGLHRMNLPQADAARTREAGEPFIYANAVKSYRTKDGLPHDDVSALLEDKSGVIWVGTSGGLCRFRDGLLLPLGTTNALDAGNVGAFHEDAKGVIWIGQGRILLRYLDGRFATVTSREGLPDDMINRILEDDLGHLWLSGDRGIYRIRKEQLIAVADGRTNSLNPVAYTDADGLLSSETNGQKSQPAGCKTPDGRLWFPTNKGVVVFDPRNLPDNTNAPPVVIEQVRADGRVVFGDRVTPGAPSATGHRSAGADPNRPAEIGTNKEVQGAGLRLPPGSARFLEIQYTANSLVAPERIRFKYRLEGLDRDWVEAGERRSAFYTDLRPGNYLFRVAAANSHGVWNETGASLALHLAPHFYQTWSFKVGCGLLVVLSVIGLVRWRLNESHRSKQEAALNLQRQQIVRDLHDDLGASLTQIAQLSEEPRQNLEQSANADARSQKIAALAGQALNHIGEIVWASNSRYDTLDDTVAYLREYAAEYLASVSQEAQFDFPESVAARHVTGEFRRHLLLVVKEVLNNAVKHAGAGRVMVQLRLNNGPLELTVMDNGRGFPLESTRRFGNGLNNIQQRVAELHGVFDLQSQLGEGTRITIKVPLPSL